MSSPFRTGGDEAEKQSAANFAGPRYFSLSKPQDSVIIRMLTEQDAWPYVLQHGFMPTKPRPSDIKDEAKWPKSMPAICQDDPALKERPGFGNCYLCRAPQYTGKKDTFNRPLSKTSVRVWALCCLREEVKEGGKVTGYRDAVIEIEDKDGSKRSVRDIRILNGSTRNLFGHLSGMYSVYKTVLDRDYVITRRGEGKDTDYPCVPLDKIAGHEPGTKSWDVYAESMKEQSLDLTEIMMERCSTAYYAKFFIPGEGDDAAEVEKGGDAPAPPDEEKLKNLRDRIRGNATNSSDS